MYELYHRGAFGNRLLTWRTLDDYLNSDYTKHVVLRYSGDTGGKFCEYGLTKDQVILTVEKWLTEGADRSKITVNELADDSLLILQGETYRTPLGLYVRYTTVPKPMRLALAEEQDHVFGLKAKLLLESKVDPQSLAEIYELLDTYPDHALEFSTWSIDVGDCYRRNTVIWEVRKY